MSIQLAVCAAVITLGGANLGWILAQLVVGRGWGADRVGPLVMGIAARALGVLLLPASGVGPIGEPLNLMITLLFALGVFIDVRYRRPGLRDALRGPGKT